VRNWISTTLLFISACQDIVNLESNLTAERTCLCNGMVTDLAVSVSKTGRALCQIRVCCLFYVVHRWVADEIAQSV
jgi:hypothetical protein